MKGRAQSDINIQKYNQIQKLTNQKSNKLKENSNVRKASIKIENNSPPPPPPIKEKTNQLSWELRVS